MPGNTGASASLTPDLCRQARDWMHMSTEELAFVARVPRGALEAFEGGKGEPSPQLGLSLRGAFERAGVRFVKVGDVLCIKGEASRTPSSLAEMMRHDTEGTLAPDRPAR